MRNILYFAITIIAIGVAVSYSLNLYQGKDISESPVEIITEKSVVTPPPSEVVNGTTILPENGQDVYSRLILMESNLNSRLSKISEASDNKTVHARFEQLSKQLEADITLVLSAVNKKEQWYRNEFYQLLIVVIAGFLLTFAFIASVFYKLKKLTLNAPAKQESHTQTEEPPAAQTVAETRTDTHTETANPVLEAVTAVATGLAVKIASNKYFFDASKAIKLNNAQKNTLTEITDDIIFLDKAGCKPSPEEYYLLGLERYAEKSFTEASALFEHVKKEDAEFALPCFMLGYIEAAAKKYEMADANLAQACAIEPENIFFLNNYSANCIKIKKYAEAAEALSSAVKVSPKDAALWNSLAHAYILQGDAEKAAEAFAKAVEIKPDFHEALHNLGLAMSRLEKYEEAVKAFESAVSVKPDKHESMYNAACVYSIMGKRDGALKHLKKAIELSPEYAKKAKTDKDFESFAGDAEFAQITG